MRRLVMATNGRTYRGNLAAARLEILMRLGTEIIAYAARLVVGGVYGSAGNMHVEVRQNRATHDVPDYDRSELHISIISGDAVADGDENAAESAVCPAAVWRAAIAVAATAA